MSSRRKLLLTAVILTVFLLFFSSASAANIIVETKYSVANPDEKWQITEAKLQAVLPSDEDKEYSWIIENNDTKEVKFSKKPAQYLTDAKGNQYATYYFPTIAGGQTKEFTVAALYGDPIKISPMFSKKSTLEGDLYDIVLENNEIDDNAYLQPSTKIESDAHEIQDKALYLVEEAIGDVADYIDDERDYKHDQAYEIVKAIFDYVGSYRPADGDFKNYDSSKANLGALTAFNVIEENTGEHIVCEDYASLMVALLRSLKNYGLYVPARTVTGFKIPESKLPDEDSSDKALSAEEMEDYRHMWVEYQVNYDLDGDGDLESDEKGIWLPADPTPSYDEVGYSNGLQFASNSYFIDTNAYYIHDGHDVVNPASLSYRGYTKLEEGEDFKYEYRLIYTPADSLDELSTYDDYAQKPFIGLDVAESHDQNTIWLKPNQVGFITLNMSEDSFDQLDSIKWISTDSSVVKIEDNYLIPTTKDGTAEIYAIVNGVKSQTKTVKIRTDAEDVDDLEKVITKLEQVTLYPGRKFELPTLKSAEISGEDGPTINWWVEDSDEGIVKIDDNELEALREGFATIWAELNGYKRSVDIRVLAEARVAEVVINQLDDEKFLVGSPSQVQVIVYVWGNDGDKTPIANMAAELRAENPDVVEINIVDEDKRIFEVTPLQFQSTNLIATANGIEGSLEMEPKELEDLVIVEPDNQQFEIGEESTVSLLTNDSDYKDILDNVPIEWYYDEDVIEVSGSQGDYTMVAEGSGTTSLQARAGNTRSGPVTIVVEEADLESLSMELDQDYVKIGETITIELIAEDESGNEYDLSEQSVSVTAEYEDLVEINSTDEVGVYELTGLKEGTTRIIASVAGITAEEQSIEVYKPKPVEVEMKVPTDNLVIGEVMEISLEATDQNGEDFDLSKSSIELVLSREDIVDVSNDGFKQVFVEGKKIGTFTMYAEVQGIQSNTESIAVIPAETEITEMLTEDSSGDTSDLLDLDEEDRQVVLGQSIDVIAKAFDKDGDELDISSLANAGIEWKVGDTDILEITEIDNPEDDSNSYDDYESRITVNAVGIGETYITASILGIKSARVRVEVMPELNYTVEKFKVNFGVHELYMNIGDEIRITPYENNDTVSGSIYNPGDDVVEVRNAGYGAVVEAVGSGTVELYWEDLDSDYESDRLIIIVGEPSERISVGELSYDIREKSLLPSIPNETEGIFFADTQNHWAGEDIALAAEMGIVGGYEENYFRPDKAITRAEFAVAFANALGLETEVQQSSFTDLENHWSKDKIEALHEVGIIGGYGDGTFRPNNEITRAEVAAVIAKALAAQSSAEEWFTDLDNAAWAKPYINKVAGLGLVNGVGEGEFAPNKNTTRAEAITIIMRLLRGLER